MRLNSSAFFAVGHIDAHLLYGNAGPAFISRRISRDVESFLYF